MWHISKYNVDKEPTAFGDGKFHAYAIIKLYIYIYIYIYRERERDR